MSSNKHAALRIQAIELRRAGKSRREIKAILGIASDQTLGDALRGEPTPAWTRRPMPRTRYGPGRGRCGKKDATTTR